MFFTRATRLAHLILYYLQAPIEIYNVIKLPTLLFSPLSCYSIFGPDIPISNEFSEVLDR